VTAAEHIAIKGEIPGHGFTFQISEGVHTGARCSTG
jgi:hypothetical protein